MTLAGRLGEFKSEQVSVARLGGDEFAIIIGELACEEDLQIIADRILERLRKPFTHANRLLDCHATIGASIYPDHGNSPAEMLKCADMALYVAKNSRRGSSLVFRASYRAEVRKRGAMIDRARKAVSDEGIVPYYQPIVKLPSREIIGFEALLRLRRPQGKSALSPAAIMAAFDDPELAAAISERIIGQVISDMRRWLDQGVPFNRIAINASAADFRREDFADSIIERLRSAGVPSRHLQLEVTETVLLGRRGDHVEQSLRLLSNEGIRIVLDDFGTGYASLSHLKQFPVYGIKIDKSFVQEMHNQPENVAIIEAILNLGSRLGLDVVAEGIETEQQAHDLLLLDCHLAQGFLFSRAIPAEGVKALLLDGK
jgi:predicted signal transduction protein with EAL and GGDEF domain